MLVLLMVVGVLGGEPQQEENKHIDLVMPGARPNMDDAYLCSSFDVEAMTGSQDTLHITGFEPHALANKAHHMLLYSCDEPNEEPGKVYDCLHHSMCRGGQSIMFAWAKNAPATTLPRGVSAAIVPNERRYLVLQVHYAHPLTEPDHTGLSLKYQTEPTKYTSGILLMMRGSLTIPPNTPVVHGDVNCRLPSNVPLHMFAYRTHAHALSPVITGYVYTEEGHKYREIARGSPQWPQAFYPMKKVETVNPDDILAARCTYNSTGVGHTTHVGSTAGDEMCNLYIMYFTEPGKVGDYLICGNEQEGSDISRGLPADSDKVPLKRPEMEAHANDIHKGGNVDEEINYAQLFEDELLQATSKKKAGMEEGGPSLTAWFNMTMPGAPSAAVPTPNLPPTIPPSLPKKPEEASSKSSISSVSASFNSMAAKVMPGTDANSSALIAAAISVPLSLLVAICLCIRRCRKRGRRSLVGGNGSGKNKFKDWSVGDVLGRNKDGFRPLNTDDRDVLLEDDSESEVEEFSAPANHA